MIIAIDGPAASGKGTLARRLADHLNLAYLDTGSLYRAVGLAMLRQGKDPHDPGAAAEASKVMQADLLEDPELRDEGVGHAASVVAAQPAVRRNLLQFQREFAHAPPPGKAGAVLDGRDIGTVVCPDADVKLFVKASDEERARRRTDELKSKGLDVTYEQVLHELKERDRRDSARAAAPLVPANDAVLLDTTELDIDAVFERALALIARRRPT